MKRRTQKLKKLKKTIDGLCGCNSDWQLGHKNPGTTDNTSNNLVLQPPIQGKYRDNYIFIDTFFDKVPCAKKTENMVDKRVEFQKTKICNTRNCFCRLGATASFF